MSKSRPRRLFLFSVSSLLIISVFIHGQKSNSRSSLVDSYSFLWSGGWRSFPFYPKSFSEKIRNCYFPADDCFAFYHAVRLIKAFYFLGSHDRIIQKLQQMQLDASKVKSRTDLLLGLRKIALDRGFRISDNEGLGNCMFYALSEQLEIVKGIKIPHGKLRQNLVQYLRSDPKLVSWC